jgi:hypothetical protein
MHAVNVYNCALRVVSGYVRGRPALVIRLVPKKRLHVSEVLAY